MSHAHPIRKVAALVAALGATGGVARATESSTEVEDRLPCGGAEIVVQTTCKSSTALGVQCTGQRLRWRDSASGKSKALVHDGNLVRKRDLGPVLDAYVDSWACVTSDQGVPYFLLSYACTLLEVGRCRGPVKEWERLVGVDGRVLTSRRSDQPAVYRRLGLSKLLDRKGLKLQGVKAYY